MGRGQLLLLHRKYWCLPDIIVAVTKEGLIEVVVEEVVRMLVHCSVASARTSVGHHWHR